MAGLGPQSTHEGLGALKLDPSKQATLNILKRDTRINNELYFRAHPELRVAMKAFTTELLAEKPDDVRAFAQRFFSDPKLAANCRVEQAATA